MWSPLSWQAIKPSLAVQIYAPGLFPPITALRRNSETSGVVVDDAKSPRGRCRTNSGIHSDVPSAGFLDRDGQQIVYEDWGFRVSQRKLPVPRAGAFRRLLPRVQTRSAYRCRTP